MTVIPGDAQFPEDAVRQRVLGRYAIVDTCRAAEYDDIALLARAVVRTPVAGIALFDGNRAWLKAAAGLDVTECPLAESFFAQHLGHTSVVVVPDATQDPRYAATSWVVQDPRARFYAGAPLVTSDGYVLGAIFCVDDSPRHMTPEDGANLTALARQVVALLELRRTEMSFHVVVDGAGHVAFHLDTQGDLVSLTPTWARLTAFGVVRSLGQPFADFLHPDDRKTFTRELERLHSESTSIRFECRLVTLMGDTVDVELFAQPLLDDYQRFAGVMGVLSDISERRVREIEVQHAQKMEALGRLSAGIAHEINTPIQFVGDNTRFLAESYETMLRLLLTYRHVLDANSGATPWAQRQDIIRHAEAQADVDYLAEEVPSAVAQSLEGVERVASIVRAMKTFSHPGQDTQAPADLNEALQATVTVARHQVKYVADVVMDLCELPPVTCKLGDLNQVFLNLIVNAGDAIAETGERGQIGVQTRTEGDCVVIRVSDSGAGVSDEIRHKIFEPFFTTKSVGRGTGQGLALARAVVQDRHGGTISVESTMGHGSIFTIRLPTAGASTGGVSR